MKRLMLVILFLLFVVPTSAKSDGYLKIWRYEGSINSGDMYEYNISFEDRMIWSVELSSFSPDMLDFTSGRDQYSLEIDKIDEDFLFLLVKYENGIYVIDTYTSVTIGTKHWSLSRETAEYIVSHVLKKGNSEKFREERLYVTDKVCYAYNEYGDYLYTRCTLGESALVLEYSRQSTICRPVLFWFEDGFRGTLITTTGYMEELPKSADTWELYWAYSIGDSSGQYDPTAYHEWWKFVSFYKFQTEDSDDVSRPVYRVMIPGKSAWSGYSGISVSGFMKADYLGTIDSSN